MDKEINDFQGNGFSPFGNMNMYNNIDMNEIYKDPMFNPIMQYEQAYSYYKYLCMQMDYKIKCKEYEKMCKNEKVT
jgi:hypothetical protein